MLEMIEIMNLSHASYHMFISYVHIICSYHMFISYMLISYVHTYAHIICS